MTDIAWDEDDLNGQRARRLLTLPTEGDGVLIFDDTGFAKQGRGSLGVARQSSGTLGKVGNRQIAVNCHYAERTIAWPVVPRLYLPRDRAGDADRRQEAKVPDEVTFRTKPVIALELLDRALQWGVRHARVGADADYGDNPDFLAGLGRRRQRYVVAVRVDFAVAASRTAPAQRTDALPAGLPRSAWRTVRWRQGSSGWPRGRFAAVRCWRVTSEGRRRLGWVIGERPGRGQDGERKHHWSNFGPEASLATMVEYAHRRQWGERYHGGPRGFWGGTGIRAGCGGAPTGTR